MVRYLLFDPGCSACSEIARAIEQEVNGQFRVRSLRDPDIQDLLNQANPDWQWQPTLLEVSDDEVRAYRGFPMGIRLIMKLGPRQALRLVKLVHRFSVSPTGMEPADPGRRHFLRQVGGSGLIGLALLLGWPRSWLFRKSGSEIHLEEIEQPTPANQVLSQGEMYAGFLLLPEEAPIPDFVQRTRGIVLDQVSDYQDPALGGETIWFNTIEELASYISFPIYIPTTLPPNVQFVDANVIQFAQSGDIWKVTIGFGTGSTADGLISVWAQPEFPRPYPVWPVRFPFAHDEGPVLPEKVTFTPSPGVMLPSVPGHVLQWIKQNILYTLAVENYSNRDTTVAIARSLVQV